MNNKYEVLIIGAGPAGLFCAYNLIKKGITNILLIERGKPFKEKRCFALEKNKCLECDTCDILTGGGGAAFFNSGKLSKYPAGSKLKAILNDDVKCVEFYNEVESIFNKYGLFLPKITSDMEYSHESEGMKIKFYESYPISKEDFNLFIDKFIKEIEKDIRIIYGADVYELQNDLHDDYLVKYIKNCEQFSIMAKNVVVACGEAGARWWKKTQDKLKVDKENTTVDVGIRIEFPSGLLEDVWRMHKDIKIKIIAPDGSEIRTYCALKNGQTVICNYGDYKVLDGISNRSSSTGAITIFNRIDISSNFDMIEFAYNMLDRHYQIYNYPIKQQMNIFLDKEFDFKLLSFKCTLEYVEDGDIKKLLPETICSNLIYGIKRVNDIIEGLADANNVAFFPVIDKLWSETKLNDTFESSVKGLYVIGDSCGHMRGIMQSCVTGLISSIGIAEKFD